MPLRVQMQNERGERIGEMLYFGPLLNRALPRFDDVSYSCWRFIDLYADTVFNYRQIGPFLEELERRRQELAQPEYDAMFDQLAALAQECQRHHYRYLKFIGD